MSRFNATLFQKFTLYDSPSTAEKTYGGRTTEPVRAKNDEMAADMQTFRASMRKAVVSQLSGVTSD